LFPPGRPASSGVFQLQVGLAPRCSLRGCHKRLAFTYAVWQYPQLRHCAVVKVRAVPVFRSSFGRIVRPKCNFTPESGFRQIWAPSRLRRVLDPTLGRETAAKRRGDLAGLAGLARFWHYPTPESGFRKVQVWNEVPRFIGPPSRKIGRRYTSWSLLPPRSLGFPVVRGVGTTLPPSANPPLPHLHKKPTYALVEPTKKTCLALA
jgi:hypothetical protein